MKNMEKLFCRKNKASVVIYAVVIIAIIIIASVGVYFAIAGSDYWEDAFEGGTWGQEIILTYADGTVQSVKNILKPGAVYDQDKEVSQITYKLSAKASGGSSSSVKIKTSGFRVDVDNIKMPQNTIVDTYSCLGGDTVKTVNVDGAWHEVSGWTISVGELFPNSLDDGLYNVLFKPDGILQYQVGSEPYQNADAPSNIYIMLTKVGGSTGQFVISFKGEAGTK